MSKNVNSQTEMPIDLLTVNDVAKRMKLSTRSIWRLVYAGSIVSPIKIGGSIRWRSTVRRSRWPRRHRTRWEGPLWAGP